MYEKDTNGPMDTVVPDTNPTVRPTLTLQEGLDRRASSMRVYGENIGQELAWLCGVITSLVDRIELLEHKLAEYDPNDYIRKDEFDPDEVWTHDQFDPDDYIHEDGLEESVERIVRSTLSDATVSINLDY
jgi:hypothetical protein